MNKSYRHCVIVHAMDDKIGTMGVDKVGNTKMRAIFSPFPPFPLHKREKNSQ